MFSAPLFWLQPGNQEPGWACCTPSPSSENYRGGSHFSVMWALIFLQRPNYAVSLWCGVLHTLQSLCHAIASICLPAASIILLKFPCSSVTNLRVLLNFPSPEPNKCQVELALVVGTTANLFDLVQHNNIEF